MRKHDVPVMLLSVPMSTMTMSIITPYISTTSLTFDEAKPTIMVATSLESVQLKF